jgi:hypothetical protein
MSFPLCTTPLKKPGQVLLHQEFWVADRTRIFLTVLAISQAIRDTFLHLTVTLLKKKKHQHIFQSHRHELQHL